MRILGIKTTHDGGVALIDDGRLVFSYEMEKLDNNKRYAKIQDLSIAFELVEEYGYTAADVDHVVLDGWHETHKVRRWFGQEVEIVLAPYRRGLVDDNLLREYPGRVQDLSYLSYTHYAGHVASAYCTSPFARLRADSYVLSWDGLMFPYLYHVDAESGRARTVGALFPMIGDTYYVLSQAFKPFDAPVEYPQNLGLAGKIMAYVAMGESRESAVQHLERIARRAYTLAIGDNRTSADRFMQLDLGAAILGAMREQVRLDGVDDADMIASLHEFLRRQILHGLRRLLGNEETGCRNLCIVGGCGLNIKWNSAVRDSGLFDEVWVPPFPNDAGSAAGTACAAMLRKTPHRALEWDVYSGPPLRTAAHTVGWQGQDCRPEALARVLHERGEPVVFLNGRAELGPRALGNRSILAPAVSVAMKDLLNDVKEREAYRPVAPICLEHRAPEVFDPGTPDPFMLFDHAVREGWQERVPAIRHLDGTARLQTVNKAQNPAIFALLTAYEQLSGIPLLCNTSANFKSCGFFPDVNSAMRWGRIPLVWSDNCLYSWDGR